MFTSETPGFLINHFDLAQAGELLTQDADATPAWIDLVERLSTAPFISIAAIRGRTRGAGNELALACDLRYASREQAVFGQPEVGIGILPGGGAGVRPGQKVLVPAGGGGLGSTVIQLAKHLGAYVATTAGTRDLDKASYAGAAAYGLRVTNSSPQLEEAA